MVICEQVGIGEWLSEQLGIVMLNRVQKARQRSIQVEDSEMYGFQENDTNMQSFVRQ